MALDVVVSQFNASVLLASEWANLALSPSTGQDLRLKAIGAAQANINLSVATQLKFDIESLLVESEAQLSTATNNGESVSTLDILRSQLDSTRKADQKALVELTAAKANVGLALKSVEVLLSTTGEDPELPQDLIDAIESVSAATLSIQASARDASTDPSQATQSAEQINGSIQKLDEARNDLDKARVDLLAAMQSMGAPTSPGLKGLVELQIAIGSLIEESQLTLSTSQTGEQATHSFSQLEKFAEALQQLAAQVESAVEHDDILKASLLLKNEVSTMPESLRTINGVGLSTFADKYIIINGSSTSIPITVNGQPASRTNPGAGWQAIAVAPSKSGSQYELIWKNNTTGQFVSWKLDASGALIKGDLLSKAGLLDLEDDYKTDINDDNVAGWNYTPGKLVNGVTLLNSDLAYAIQKADGSIVKISFNGQFASKDNPGAGWQAIAVAPSKSGSQYELIWKNNTTGQFVSWKLDASGALIKGDLLSKAGLLDLEDDYKTDINDDNVAGWNYTPGKLVNGVTLLNSDLAYAIQKADGSIVKISFNGQFASKDNPGAGWQAIAVAPSKSGSQYELIWKNNTTGQFVSWKLDASGALIKGDLLSKAGLLDLEDDYKTDINDDKVAGWNYTPGKLVNGVTLLNNDLAYAIQKADGSIVKISFNGQFASKDNPGAGWQAIAVAPSKSGSQYELIWKNNTTGQFVSWKLDASGALIKGDLLSKAGLLDLEDDYKTDINDDNVAGWNYTPGKLVNGVTLLNSDLAYAIQKADGSIVKISFNGQFASKDNPGAGWQAIAVAPSKSGSQYELIWKNNTTGQFVSWKLDASGALIKGDLLSKAGLLDLEDDYKTDINDDNVAGWNYTPGKLVNGVTLLNSDLAYAIQKADGSIVKISFNGQFASKDNPGAGWQAVAVAPSKSGSQYELIWKNNTTGQFVSWKLDASGALIKGDLLSKAGLLDLEDDYKTDINDDKVAGWNYTPGKLVNGVTLLNNDLAYAIQKADGSIVKISFNGQFASKDNPGAGWQAIAVAPSKSGSQYELIWKNNTTGQFVSWKLDASGALIKGDLLSKAGLLDLEDDYKTDINDDKVAGWNYTPGKLVNGVTLLNSDLAYAIQKADGSIVKISFNGQFASKDNPGAGWQAVAVAPSENGDYHLYWDNKANPSSTLARWEVSASGSYREGKALSESEFNLDELNIKQDLNDDQRIGPFQKVEGKITQDILTANPDNPFQVLYGRQGKDQLTSGSQNSLGFDILIGGSGDDSYFVPDGTSALITEQGGNDILDELIARSINTPRSKFATLEGGRHLGIIDQTTNTSLFIYDWQQESNRIEVFTMQDRAYTFDQFKQAVMPTGQVVPDLTWGQWDQQFGIGHISHTGLAQGVTLAKLAETYSSI